MLRCRCNYSTIYFHVSIYPTLIWPQRSATLHLKIIMPTNLCSNCPRSYTTDWNEEVDSCPVRFVLHKRIPLVNYTKTKQLNSSLFFSMFILFVSCILADSTTTSDVLCFYQARDISLSRRRAG